VENHGCLICVFINQQKKNQMSKNLKWYLNGTNKTIDESISLLMDNVDEYLRKSGTVLNAEKLLEKIDVNAMTIDEITDEILNEIGVDIDDLGKLPIMCKDGKVREYNPEWWAETFARGRTRSLQEEGLHNQMTELGFDLVIVSKGGSGDACSNWEGEILSITGETEGYRTVEEAQESGEIFHWNCVHSTSSYLLTKDEDGNERVWGRGEYIPEEE
jgi:hypothetical protein